VPFQAPAIAAAEVRLRLAKEAAAVEDQELQQQLDRRRRRLDRRAQESVHKKRQEAQNLQVASDPHAAGWVLLGLPVVSTACRMSWH
jgi:hypothetical protein